MIAAPAPTPPIVVEARSGRQWSVERVLAGGGVRVLWRSGTISGDPTWAPDGRTIVFASNRGGKGLSGTELWSMRPDGTQGRRLTHDGAADEHPSVSPDGRLIAWSHGRTALWVMRSDGTHRRRLADGQVLARPSWSPDGARILVETDGGRYGSPQLRVVPLAGGPAVALQGLPANASDPAWSHDGTRLAFCAGGAIYVADADGANARPVTTTADPAAQPTWSPDDRRLAFTLVGAARNAIGVVGVDGSDQHVVLASATISFDSPTW